MDLPLLLVLPGLLIAGIVGSRANKKNRSGWRWGLFTGSMCALFIFSAIVVPSQSSRQLTIIFTMVGLISLVGCLLSLIILACLPHLCPQCREKVSRKQLQEKKCQKCGHAVAGKKTNHVAGPDAVVVVAGLIVTFIALSNLIENTGKGLLSFIVALLPGLLAVVFVVYRNRKKTSSGLPLEGSKKLQQNVWSATIKSGADWLGQIIPPMLILTLATMPPDMGSSLFWMAAGIASIISLFMLIKCFVRWCFGHKDDLSLRTLLRPTLTIICMILATISVVSSLRKAEEFAYDAAVRMQSICNAEGICPEKIPGWQSQPGSFACYTLAGDLAKYPVKYLITSEERKEFSIVVRKSIDSSTTHSGGVGKELKRQ